MAVLHRPFLAVARRQLSSPPPPSSADRPFVLVSRRHHDTMNSWLGDLPGLRAGKRFNEVEIHPEDAARLGAQTGSIVRVSSSSGSIELPAVVTDATSPGVITIEQGWGSSVFDPTGRETPDRYGVNRNALVSDTDLDPLSQMPALNSQAVQVALVTALLV